MVSSRHGLQRYERLAAVDDPVRAAGRALRALQLAAAEREGGQVAVKPGQRQQAQHACGHGDKPDPFGRAAGTADGAGQRAEPGGIDERYLGQVGDYPVAA